MSLFDGGCSVCGEPALSTCTRCDSSICVHHKIVSEPGLNDPGISEVFCPRCWEKRGTIRKTSDLLDRAKEAWNVVVGFLILVGLISVFVSWLFGWK